MRTFVHDLRGATAIGGSFELQSEHRLTLDDREVLVLLGVALVDAACCGASGCRYALVPGYLEAYHAAMTAEGVPISQVEPVVGEAAQRAVRQAITGAFTVNQVVFW
jgi:hypothetical protein